MNDNNIDCASESGRVNLVVVMIWSADGTDGASQIVHDKKTRVFGSRQFIVLRYSISVLRHPLHAQTADHIAADFQSYCLLKSYFTHQHTGMLRSLKKNRVSHPNYTDPRATHHFVPPGAAGASETLSNNH